MADFEKAIAKTLPAEGYYVNDPDDPGGETYCGITRRNYPHWAGWPIIDKHKPLKWNQHVNDPVLEHLVKQLYHDTIWEEIQGNAIQDDQLACSLFDWRVNSGMYAVQSLQLATGQYVDGVLGPKTLAAINAHNPKILCGMLQNARRAFVQNIVKRRPSQKKYLAGWLKRIAKFDYAD
jgi:lysozyme family protein